MNDRICFFDLEVSERGKILDIGAVRGERKLHSSSLPGFANMVKGCEFLCGHNIIEHDLKYAGQFLNGNYKAIDTLYLSPLLFPTEPYHRLLKDDKLLSEELNNPLNDSLKAKQLYEDEAYAFQALSKPIKEIYHTLTAKDEHFSGFYDSLGYTPERKPFFLRKSIADTVKEELSGLICRNADIESIVKKSPVALAYAISLIKTDDRESITPPWVLKNYPETETILWKLRNNGCSAPNCPYCTQKLDAGIALKQWFGYDKFRLFGGEPLQEKAVKAAVGGESLLAIFPTGGGKSLTFQLPALIAGESVRGLTVIISPLQSLMKDQVENLEKKGITDAVYINGLLSPIERRDALERVFSGEASMLYIAPEQLRSKTIEKALLSRTVVRIVIDEAHCFSAWGQDFRIEYMYIADFINSMMSKKGMTSPIPVSCFTATAKPKVISDIMDYFRDRLGISLQRFTTDETRSNLHYTVLYRADEEDKYKTLRDLLNDSSCPAIVYVTRTKTAENIAAKLCDDGLNARAFHGQMDTLVKVHAQNDFMENHVRIIVATSAFGMGVDKSDVGLVVHFEISDSLENYIQEAGRAGRDTSSEADCYVLYNDDDLNRHFILLNQTKLTLSEINQVWRAIKQLTTNHNTVHISALEIARKAGWEEIRDVETKVKSAIAALENAGYLRRGMNSPRIFATSIVPRNMEEASAKIELCPDFSPEEKTDARRIIKSLISERSRAKAGTAEAESRIDYLSDMLGIETKKVISIIERMRLAGLLAKDEDMTAYLRLSQIRKLAYFAKLEMLLTNFLLDGGCRVSLKQINEKAVEEGISGSSVKDIKTILFFWMIRGYVGKASLSDDYITLHPKITSSRLAETARTRNLISQFILNKFRKSPEVVNNEAKVSFSLAGLVESYDRQNLMSSSSVGISMVEEALLFLSKTGIINLEGGFMVLYNKLDIERLNMDNRSRYRKEEYHNLDEFYAQRIQQIHIVGKYANMMVSDKEKAMQYVHDYFVMEFKPFIKKYFDDKEAQDIKRNVSKKKYDEIFGSLTDTQSAIIRDSESRFIVVPAGPGSGKTYVLVRKLASLILMEDIKSEQLLMLTFSRASAIEFKSRLKALIGNAAEFVEIKTFHSYSFDILGKVGTLENSDHIVADAVSEINAGRVEKSLITKSILVIDEAQDMSKDEFNLVKELIQNNEDMRIVAVGDDDQNIYEFRGSDSGHMKSLITEYGATVYDMMDNFRSSRAVVSLANSFVRTISNRLKSSPISGRRNESGEVRLIKHQSPNYEQAIVDEILSENKTGKSAVLTSTNDNALIITALLNKNGRKARLIQSRDGFTLANLAEIRCFLDEIRSRGISRVDQSLWDGAKEKMCNEFRDSSCLDIALNCIKAFETEYPKSKYVSDFNDYLLEAQLESFSKVKDSEILVSTIHKSKGCEYDNVYLSLKGWEKISDSERRALYVGITRARNNLSVHYDTNIYGLCRSAENILTRSDATEYGLPDEIMLQLTHRDVVLDMFKGKEKLITGIHSGKELYRNGDYLEVPTDKGRRAVVKFSSAFKTRLTELATKGYVPSRAVVRFQVYWKSADENVSVSIPIILPDLYLERK
jgi:ATP-dependent DNA helicase RecQ